MRPSVSPSPSEPSFPFDVWVAALASGYLPHSAFVRWADALIERNPHQPKWVLDLSLSRDAREATSLLGHEWSRQSDVNAHGAPTLGEPGSLHLGFLYLRFAAGQMTMAELLTQAGLYADGQGYFVVDTGCESFFYLLNEIDGGGPTEPSHRPLASRVDELFAPYAGAARATLPKLPAP